MTQALVVVVIFDFITGWTASVLVRGGAESSVGRIGIARKTGIFVVVGLVNVLDQTGIYHFADDHRMGVYRQPDLPINLFSRYGLDDRSSNHARRSVTNSLVSRTTGATVQRQFGCGMVGSSPAWYSPGPSLYRS